MKPIHAYWAVLAVLGIAAGAVVYQASNGEPATTAGGAVPPPTQPPSPTTAGSGKGKVAGGNNTQTQMPTPPQLTSPPTFLPAGEQAKQDEMQVFHDSLLHQPTTDLLTQWQAESVSPVNEPPYGTWKLQRLEAVLAQKLAYAPADDPAYIQLQEMALASGNADRIAAAGHLLGMAGSPAAIGIAQAMLAHYAVAGNAADEAGLQAGYEILRQLPAARSALRPTPPPPGITYVDGKDMYGFPPPVSASPLPPVTDALKTAWGNVQGNGQEAGITRLHLANALVKEGDAEGVGFLLQTLDTSQDTDTRQLLQGTLGGVDKPEKTQLLLQWAQTKATDTDAATAKSWFGQAALYRYDPVPGGQVTTVNVIKPLAESGSFQSEAVKTAVLEGIAEQERQLSPQLSPQLSQAQ